MMGEVFGMGSGMWLLWIALIVLIVWAVWWPPGTYFPPSDDRSQETIKVLKERLARGEIDTEEYERLRDELEN